MLHLRIGTEDGFAVRPVPRLSRFIRAFFQFSKRAAGEAAKFGRGGVELLDAARSRLAVLRRSKVQRAITVWASLANRSAFKRAVLSRVARA